MPYIKKLVFNGFKSFAHEIEIPFESGMNVIVGPNGSGKSNIVDGICFVFGRLSMKSIRAEKSTNLIFSGSKTRQSASEAIVKIVFDNADKGFSLDSNEVVIERIVKENGQGIYKMNNEVKTRQEILEMLASGGIDPYGFNIILQGEISRFAQMHPEERRKVIEEVAGISVYEARKERSLRELEKTEDKLKEVNAIVRERTSYLKNLEEERQQALRFKHAEELIKKCKASLLHKDMEEKKKELLFIEKDLQQHAKVKDKIQSEMEKIQQQIQTLDKKINEITDHIQTSSGIEQEKLHEEIMNLRTNIAAQQVRREHLENRIHEIQRRRQELEKSIQGYEKEIEDLKIKSPLIAKKQEELRKKRSEFSQIEDKRKWIYGKEHELASLKERIKEKFRAIERVKKESEMTLKHIELLYKGVSGESLEACNKSIQQIQQQIEHARADKENLGEEKVNFEKKISVREAEISRLQNVKNDVQKLDICPLCQSTITHSHITHVTQDCEEKSKKLDEERKTFEDQIHQMNQKKVELLQNIEKLEQSYKGMQGELLKLQEISNKQSYLAKLHEDLGKIEEEIQGLDRRKKTVEGELSSGKEIDEKYDKILLEIEEISSLQESNIDTSILYKERELESIKNIIKRSFKDEESLLTEKDEVAGDLSIKEKQLSEKERDDQALAKKFKKWFDDRLDNQKAMHEKNTFLMEVQQNLRGIEDKINNGRVEKARVDAEFESLSIEFKQYETIELVQGTKEHLQDRLQKAEYTITSVGSVNLRALEVYDSVKQEYDMIQEKVKKLDEEKGEILKVLEEIDKKKKRSFMKTLDDINEILTRNFMQLSTKGQAFLELENKENPFIAGLDIILKVGRGKYFDITSLSGGEQTLVALALIFAIQEYKPYSFYLLDEIDAALDKRNSEKLAMLVKKHMKTGQYIIITHNDAVITEASTLYGVTMQEGVSRVVSLKL